MALAGHANTGIVSAPLPAPSGLHDPIHAKPPDLFGEIPPFLRQPIAPIDEPARRLATIAFSARRFLLNDLYGPALATILFVVAGGAAVAGALHLQDIDIDLRRVLGVAQASPALEVLDALGREDVAIALPVTVTARLGTELEPLRISGVPEGAMLTAGEPDDTGVWIVPIQALPDLQLIPPQNYHGSIALAVEATARDGEKIDQTVEHLAVQIKAVADVPTLNVRDITGREDEARSLGVFAQLGDPQETLSISIRGLPPGASLSAGKATADGSWIVDPGDLDTVQLIPPQHFKGSFPLRVDVTAHDASDSVVLSRGFDVRIPHRVLTTGPGSRRPRATL